MSRRWSQSNPDMAKRYCSYCGKVAHRCGCDAEDSHLHQFFARSTPAVSDYYPRWMMTHYKRGVPPQIKRKERYTLRKHHQEWYQALVLQHGEQCLNCGITAQDSKLVLDHMISIAKGGLSELDNLQILCETCNRIKGKLCIDCRSDTN